MKRNFFGKSGNRTLLRGIMAGLSLTIVLAGALLLAVPSSGAPQAAALRLATPSGRVVYKMTNAGAATMSGTITMTWADYGRRIRQDMQMRMAGGPQGKPMNMSSWAVFDGQTVTSAIPGQSRRAMRMKLPPNFNSQMLVGGMPGATRSGPGKIVGRASLLGKPCVIRLVTLNTAHMNSRSKMWMWQNLPLRAEVTMQFKNARATPSGKSAPRNMPPMRTTMVATQLNTTIRPAASTFRVPAGYTIQDMGDMQKQMRAKPR